MPGSVLSQLQEPKEEAAARAGALGGQQMSGRDGVKDGSHPFGQGSQTFLCVPPFQLEQISNLSDSCFLYNLLFRVALKLIKMTKG